MFDMYKQARNLQEKMGEVTAALAGIVVGASSAGGTVAVEANGKLEVVAVHLRPEALRPEDAAALEKIVASTVNEALAKAREAAAREMARAAGGAGLPGLPGMP